jgi:hypothetical protein
MRNHEKKSEAVRPVQKLSWLKKVINQKKYSEERTA